jgi:glycosyltransferase involved in cell wall biosynthesis
MDEQGAEMLISAVIPVGGRHSDISALYQEYRSGLQQVGARFELIFVIDGPHADVVDSLERIQREDQSVVVVLLTRSFGEATALMAGFQQAHGSIIMTLPAYYQIEASELPKLVAGLEMADMAVARRQPRAGGLFERLRRSLFHGLVAWVTGLHYSDLGCGARVFKKRVIDEISLYGDQHRFLAVLANRQGFRVTEVDVHQSPKDRFDGSYRVREYAHRVLDILTLLFLVRFTKKPLRFFGMVGVITFSLSALVLVYLGIDRLVFGAALADRPALLLASLLAVVGLQLFAIGLLGELIIFTHARHLKDYQVEEVIRFPREAAAPGDGVAPRPALSVDM